MLQSDLAAWCLHLFRILDTKPDSKPLNTIANSNNGIPVARAYSADSPDSDLSTTALIAEPDACPSDSEFPSRAHDFDAHWILFYEMFCRGDLPAILHMPVFTLGFLDMANSHVALVGFERT